MNPLPFIKAVASGNDFVIVDNRRGIVKNPAQFCERICNRHQGIGADGLLLFENSRKTDFKMRILNSDGSEAEACGNGFRCIALFAKEKLGYPAGFRFEALAGIIQARVNGKSVRVEMVNPSGLKKRAELQVQGHRLHYSFLNTGVPHAVIFVEGLSKVNVEELGRAIRHHKDFHPKGTNVNFVQVENEKAIHVRTYERGVEKETLACGTGSTASAILSSVLGSTRPPVRVKTSGGEILNIDFKLEGDKITQVTLEGEARLVFEGKFFQ